ncbi:MAG: hypothetical protein IJZ63_07295, partial [Clostridia bacterium]|nr:hypothetical protein [Clostridia bacterium]
MILDFVLVLGAFLVFISNLLYVRKFTETKKWQYKATNSVLPQTKAYLTSFKKTTNPNASPIGKRFGFECFGADEGT